MRDVPKKAASPELHAAPNAASEIAQGFRALCGELRADSFHLYRIAAHERRLAPVLDSAYPGTAERTAALVKALPRNFAEHAAATHCIFWWAEAASPVAVALQESDWAVRLAASGAGVALPLADHAGRHGVVVFTGRCIHAGEAALTEAHARCHTLFDRLPEAQPQRRKASLPAVSQRELQCLRLTADGLTSEDIARELGLSVHTANQYLANAAEKLDAANRVHAVAKALREGLIE